MAHANARTNPYMRSVVVQRYLAGHRVQDIAAQLGISRTTAYKWIARFDAEGPAGLADRPSRPQRSPRRTPLDVELLILQARMHFHAGPAQLAAELELPASTIGAVLRRWQVPHLADLDRITGELLRGRATEIATSTTVLATCCTSTSRSSGASRQAAAGASTDSTPTTAAVGTRRAALSSSTSPSTTTAASSTPRSTPTSAPRPAPPSCTAPPAGSTPSTVSPSAAS